METGMLSETKKGLGIGLRRELSRNGIGSVFRNRINIALQSSDRSQVLRIIKELHLIMENRDLTKGGLITIFEGEENIVEFIEDEL